MRRSEGLDAGTRPEARSPRGLRRPAGVRRRSDRAGQPAAELRALQAARPGGPPSPRAGRVATAGSHGRRARRADADAGSVAVPGSHRSGHPVAVPDVATGARRVRPSEPPPERLSSLLHDGLPWRDPDPGTPSPQGADPAGCERLALSAPRWRPPRAGLRQRCVLDAAVQPVRLLRGRPDARVTTPAPDDDRAGTYQAAVAALAERGRFGVRLGLGRTRGLLRAMGDPQLAVRGALVGGTNGKGSVLALAGSALKAAGLRAGETPKPHLTSYRERLQIDGRRLGPTIAHIAREKAAIIERRDVAVTGATGEAREIVRRRAARLHVPLTIVEPAAIVGLDREGLVVELPRLGETRVALLGRHQAANVGVADAILDALEA